MHCCICVESNSETTPTAQLNALQHEERIEKKREGTSRGCCRRVKLKTKIKHDCHTPVLSEEVVDASTCARSSLNLAGTRRRWY